jgi:succinate dehydrogenase/fumarate reductase cytochrome b subunit
MAKRKSDVGTLYKGSPGQWSWLLHRITGVAVILFLFAHVVDTAVVGWGPDAYNRVVGVFRCRTTFNWTEACPRGIEVTKAIQDVKRSILFERF